MLKLVTAIGKQELIGLLNEIGEENVYKVIPVPRDPDMYGWNFHIIYRESEPLPFT